MPDSALSRQDTIPAEDPSWSYLPVPGQPAPIPPRNEPLLFIPNHTALANVYLPKDHLLPAAIEGNVETTSPTNTANSGYSDKEVAVLNFHHVSMFFDLVSHADCSTISQEPKPRSGMNDDILPSAAMASLTIHETTSLQASGTYCSNIEAQRN